MIAHFPSPVLSVSADVVQELEGEDALYGLWALFTKCKESLKDGRRLENISWRLWYREIAAQHSPSSSPGVVSPTYCEKRSASPITPVSEDNEANDPLSPPPLDGATGVASVHSWHGDMSMLTALASGRRLSTASVPMDRLTTHHGVGVGRLIIDILPGKLDMTQGRKSPQAMRAIAPQVPRSSPVPSLAQSRPVVSLQLPNTPPTATPSFPRVVVVNPTPHPTPPATPNVARGPAALTSGHTPTHLLPPPSTRSMIAAAVPVTAVKSAVTSSVKPPVSSQPAASTSRDGFTRSSSERGDDTLKPSDRRFFLQEAAESPERDSPDTASQPTDGKSDDGHAHSLSSAASSHLKSDGGSRIAGPAAKRGGSKAQARKSKETLKHAPVRPANLHRTQTQMHLQRERQAAQRKAANGEPKKTTFNIGSVSSNGSRAPVAGPSKLAPKEPAVTRPQQAEPTKPANGVVQPPRRNIVVSTSSDYETTDTDDDSEWASEDNSAEDPEKEKREREALRLREAAEEAQRQRDMFAKVPKRSYSNLNRTQSGLLSQLLNPDPNLFPPNHPYRTRGFSSQDMTQFARQATAPPLQTSKSSVAVPLAAQVTAQAPPTNGSGLSNTRPKGRPHAEELEEESDSDDESADNAIQVSRSLAQQKLEALADSSRRRNSDRGPPPTEATVRPVIPSVATAPIPLGHPYNLPAPAPVMTPRTTRRQMLSTELSESLRRNLLWERQVSRNALTGARRGGVLGNNLRPLTAMTSDPQKDDSGSKSGHEGDDKDERRQRTVARNRSWADDYHYAGW